MSSRPAHRLCRRADRCEAGLAPAIFADLLRHLGARRGGETSRRGIAFSRQLYQLASSAGDGVAEICASSIMAPVRLAHFRRNVRSVENQSTVKGAEMDAVVAMHERPEFDAIFSAAIGCVRSHVAAFLPFARPASCAGEAPSRSAVGPASTVLKTATPIPASGKTDIRHMAINVPPRPTIRCPSSAPGSKPGGIADAPALFFGFDRRSASTSQRPPSHRPLCGSRQRLRVGPSAAVEGGHLGKGERSAASLVRKAGGVHAQRREHQLLKRGFER